MLGQDRFTISGKIIDKASSQVLSGANVFETITEEGTSSNAEGEYLLLLPEGNYNFKISYIGYNSIEREVYLNKNITIDFQLEPDPIAILIDIRSSNFVEKNKVSKIPVKKPK